MPKHLDEVEFTIFDTETTGLDPFGGDRIVEIAALKVKGQQRLGSFQALVNPHRAISPAAYEVNHISQEMIERSPGINTVMPQFLDFIHGSCLCSYNAAFDLGFLDNELEILGQPPLRDIMVVDILKMARRLLPELERYALWFVAGQLGLNNQQEHRALADVELTFGVFSKLKDTLNKKGIADLTNFTALFGINPRVAENINNQKIAEIQEAIGLGVKLKIKYISSLGEVTEREVTPKEIRQENKRAYLLGHCALRGEERSFRIDGILHLEIL
jgi:DNA polymerase III epsilon subunit family exonuclease